MKPEHKYKLIEKIIQTEYENILNEVESILERPAEIIDEHKKILDERLAEHRANPDDTIDWADFKAIAGL